MSFKSRFQNLRREVKETAQQKSVTLETLIYSPHLDLITDQSLASSGGQQFAMDPVAADLPQLLRMHLHTLRPYGRDHLALYQQLLGNSAELCLQSVHWVKDQQPREFTSKFNLLPADEFLSAWRQPYCTLSFSPGELTEVLPIPAVTWMQGEIKQLSREEDRWKIETTTGKIFLAQSLVWGKSAKELMDVWPTSMPVPAPLLKYANKEQFLSYLGLCWELTAQASEALGSSQGKTYWLPWMSSKLDQGNFLLELQGTNLKMGHYFVPDEQSDSELAELIVKMRKNVQRFLKLNQAEKESVHYFEALISVGPQRGFEDQSLGLSLRPPCWSFERPEEPMTRNDETVSDSSDQSWGMA